MTNAEVTPPRKSSSWKKKATIVIAAVVGGFAVLVLAGQIQWRMTEHARLYGPLRKEWKEKAVAEINRLSGDPKWLANEIDTLKKKIDTDTTEPESWYSDHLILLKNGEWIVCS